MSKDTEAALLIMAGWLVLVASMVGVYIVIQVSHEPTTPQERAYRACLYETASNMTDKCKYLEKNR